MARTVLPFMRDSMSSCTYDYRAHLSVILTIKNGKSPGVSQESPNLGIESIFQSEKKEATYQNQKEYGYNTYLTKEPAWLSDWATLIRFAAHLTEKQGYCLIWFMECALGLMLWSYLKSMSKHLRGNLQKLSFLFSPSASPTWKLEPFEKKRLLSILWFASKPLEPREQNPEGTF
ncbi:hypothetical protein VNO77_44678 [Canavalia gladiata]|uniref:Uncharacterized protein n=1 Tax=Canavalia gladiata TaxID=3824 RepID=A0AAN9PR91_CANGL